MEAVRTFQEGPESEYLHRQLNLLWRLLNESALRLNKYGVIFDIHMSVHRNIITNYSQQTATSLEYIYLFLQTLHMFQAVSPPIIRST